MEIVLGWPDIIAAPHSKGDVGLATQPERIAALEADKKWHWIAIVALAVIGLGWLSWMSITLIGVKADLQAVKQKVEDGGLGEIVSELRSPKSTEQLRANLIAVSSQLQVARIKRQKPDEKKLTALSNALSNVVKRNSELPEAWQAASQLVSTKYQPSESALSLPNCLESLPTDAPEIDRVTTPAGAVSYPAFLGPQLQLWTATVLLEHCSLDLDDDGNFNATTVGKFFVKVKKHHPQTSALFLLLNDAQITYSGGKMLPVAGFQFTNCTFGLKLGPNLPNKNGREMTSQLLEADKSMGTVHLPEGM